MGFSNDRTLTLRQKRFCQFYLETSGNGTEAIIRAGYNVSRKNGIPDRNLAKSIASENLTKPAISQYLSSLMEGVGITPAMVRAQHAFLIRQCDDLSVKIKAIDLYYKLTGQYKAAKDESQNAEINTVLEKLKSILPA